MVTGIFAKTFTRPTLESTLDAVVDAGLAAIQFNMALTAGPTLSREVDVDIAPRVRQLVADRGLQMAAVSGTYNMAHPDRERRRDGAAGLARLVGAAGALGTEVVTLCTGSRDPEDMWRWHPDNLSPGAWADMLDSVVAAVEHAEHHGVVLGVEPEHNNVVCDARAARRLLDHVGSSNLKIVLDAANLIDPGRLDAQHDVLAEAIELLGDDLVLAHAKDVRPDGKVVAAGRGALDYDLYCGLLDQAGYSGALVLHGLAEAEVPRSVEFLAGHVAGRSPDKS
jgi:sugar phosphate isomerase/epimerase